MYVFIDRPRGPIGQGQSRSANYIKWAHICHPPDIRVFNCLVWSEGDHTHSIDEKNGHGPQKIETSFSSHVINHSTMSTFPRPNPFPIRPSQFMGIMAISHVGTNFTIFHAFLSSMTRQCLFLFCRRGFFWPFFATERFRPLIFSLG